MRASGPIKRMGHERFRRNVMIAAVNFGDSGLIPAFRAALAALWQSAPRLTDRSTDAGWAAVLAARQKRNSAKRFSPTQFLRAKPLKPRQVA